MAQDIGARAVRFAIFILAAASILIFLPACKTIRNLPADTVIAGGTGGSVLLASAIGGPPGIAVGIAGTTASIIAAEEFVRPECPISILPPGAIPSPPSGSPSPPWFLNPEYYWGVIILVLAAIFLIKFAFGARFRGHIRNAVWAFLSGQFRAGFGYLFAASGMIHSEKAEKMEAANSD